MLTTWLIAWRWALADGGIVQLRYDVQTPRGKRGSFGGASWAERAIYGVVSFN